jgi:hypothetical protein
MVTAPVLDLEEPRPGGIRPPPRRELPEGFDLWLDGVEEG